MKPLLNPGKLSGCLLLLGSLTFAQNTPATTGKYKALLVGIDHYRSARATPGCVDDARETARFLQTKFGFPEASIKLLLNEQATAQNIRQAFREWLIEGTAPGDRVFFLYAGHGSQLTDDNGDEPDGKDETLAPYNVDPRTGANQIRDDEFERMMRQLSQRLVVMVFDSCHSGTISRSTGLSTTQGPGARFLPSPEEFAQMQQSASRSTGDYIVTATRDQSRDLKLFVDPAASKDLAGIVVFSAAGANQIAEPIDFGNGKDRGALSWVFAEVQQGRLPTLAELRTLIPTRIKSYQEQKKLAGNQVPVIEAISSVSLEQQPLFASEEKIPEIALANPQSPIKVSLRTTQQKSRFKIGETVSYHVETDTAGYLYLLVFSQGRVATCIFPNAEDSNNQIPKGTLTIPRGRYEFPIQEPIGRDVVVALVTRERLNLGEKVDYTWDEVFRRLNIAELQSSVSAAQQRGQGVKRVDTPLAPRDWQAAVLLLETIR
jgi:hypothetical protein